MRAKEMSQDKRENLLLHCTLFFYIINGAAAQPLGSFIPFLREAYGLSYEFTGIMISFQSIGNMVSIFIAGILPMYIGRRKSILLMGIWMGVSYIILASGTGIPIFLLLACLMNGISRGSGNNFGSTMISTLPEKKAKRGFNLLHGFFALGALSSPLLLVLFDKIWPVYGWRLMAGFLVILLIFQYIDYATMPVPEIKPGSRGKKKYDRGFLKERSFWLSSAVLFCYVSAEYALMGWMVTYFQDIGVLRPEHAQLTNSILWLVIFLGRMMGAAISGKFPAMKLLLLDGIGQFVFFLMMFFSSNPVIIIIALMGVGFCFSTIYPTAFGIGSEYVKGNDLGCSIMTLSGSVGGVLTPALVGFVAGAAGIKAGMGVIIVLTGMLLCAILVNAVSLRIHSRKLN